MKGISPPFFFTIWIGLITLASCEERFDPELSEAPPQLVVEGYIEAGDVPSPPYVFLTETRPFLGSFDAQTLSDMFVHDARITVSDGETSVQLEEVCYEDVPTEFRDLIFSGLDLPYDSLGINFCVYTDFSLSLLGQEGKTYTLEVDAKGQTLEAVTTIPQAVVLDSVFFKPVDGDLPDYFRELFIRFKDPENVANYYRYFTSTNRDLFFPGYTSVSDDVFFDGLEFEFNLPKGQRRDVTINPIEFGLFEQGDTVIVRWCSLDKAHFEFWNTLEFNTINQGPFSSYTRINSNIENGLGIWGGYGVRYYPLIAE